MNNQDNRNSINYQDHPHQEGQQNNTAPDGQPNSGNNQQPMSNMMQESEEQKAGRAHGQKDDRPVQEDERQP